MRLMIAALIILLATSMVIARSQPLPFGAAEARLHQLMVGEVEYLYDANYAHACGLRSGRWLDVLHTSARIANTEVRDEQRPLARDPARFDAFADYLSRWWSYTWRKMKEPVNRETCGRVAARLPVLDSIVSAGG